MKAPVIGLALLLAGCGSSPAPRVYVLSPPVDPVPHASSESGRPILEVQRVSIPDYLDSTEMMQRDGRNELKVSATGRWGERLSIGVTDALRADLDHRLTGMLVTTAAPSGQAATRLRVDIDALDVRPDGLCVLTARWSIARDNGPGNATTRRDTLVTQAGVTQAGVTQAGVTPAAGTGAAHGGDGVSDAAAAAAMAAAVEQLADKIAAAMAGYRYPGVR